MAISEHFERARPGSLGNALRQVHPEAQFDPVIRRSIGDWVAYEETTSALAKARAEPHIHQYLVKADHIGRVHGRAACMILWWPLAGLGLTIFIIVLLLKS
jgi:hypothetical protein